MNCELKYYVPLSLPFLIANLFTLENLAPWIDEVMFLDTSYNAAVHGVWETTAWYRVAGQHPFSTYPPLYQMLSALWMQLFGCSLVAVRSLNLLLTFVLGVACLRLMPWRRETEGRGRNVRAWTTVLFTLLLWGTGEIMWMYRNGRPDMLCALTFVSAVLAIRCYLLSHSVSGRLAVVVASALLPCAGIQAATCLMALWLFSFVVAKGRRREALRLLPFLLTGILLGLLLVAFFMLAHGRLLGFASSIMQYSSTLSAIALSVLPWAGRMLDFDPMPYTRKLLELSAQPSLDQRLTPIVEYRSFLILSVICFIAFVTIYRHRLRSLSGNMGFLSLLYAFYVPVAMNVAGRFTVYYRWMTFLPLVWSVVYVAVRDRRWLAVFCATALVLAGSGLRSMQPAGQWDHECLHSFVRRRHFRPSDSVVCPFSLFYEMKPLCDTCYFVGIFPTEYLGRVDYIIAPEGGDAFDRPIVDYVNRLRTDSTIVLIPLDYCSRPPLTLYKVEHRTDSITQNPIPNV